MTTKILAFAGSAARDSVNKKLVRVAAEAARAAGAEVTLIDLVDYPMPIYDADLESREGLPANARKLRELFISHNALLIASPEHNASVTALLKNTLDWLSRPDGGQNGTVPYQNKVAALMAASPGAYGGLRALPQLRAIMQTLGVLTLSEQFALARAHEAFAPDGSLIDLRAQASVAGVAQKLVTVTGTLDRN